MRLRRVAFLEANILQKVVRFGKFRRNGIKPELASDVVCPLLGIALAAMHHKHAIGAIVKGVQPTHQAHAVGMRTGVAQHFDMGVYRDVIAQDAHPFGAVLNGVAEGAYRLISHKEDGAFVAPQIVLQMVADTSRLAHAAGGNDHLGTGVLVDHTAVIRRDADAQSLKPDGVDAGVYEVLCLLVVVHLPHFGKDVGGFNGKRAVHHDGKSVVSFYLALLLDATDKVKDLLRASHRKGGDHHVAAAVQRVLNDARKVILRAARDVVHAVGIGAFHHDVIGIFQIFGVVQKRLIGVADIAREDQGLGGTFLSGADGDGGGTQEVPRVGEFDAESLKKLFLLPVLQRIKIAADVFRILHGVQRLDHKVAATLIFSIAPLGVALLDVSAVKQHDVAQLFGGGGAEYLAAKTLFVEERKPAAVVDVRVRQNDVINSRSIENKAVFLAVKHVRTLAKPTIDQNVFA